MVSCSLVWVQRWFTTATDNPDPPKPAALEWGWRVLPYLVKADTIICRKSAEKVPAHELRRSLT